MSFLSKLLGNNADAKAALDRVKGAVQGAVNEANTLLNDVQHNAQRPAQQPAQQQYAPQRPAEQPASGFSWGEEMPAEENQYNYPGTYIEYFRHVFQEDFAEYAVTMEPGLNDRSPLFVFHSAGRRALVVELKSEGSSAQRIRKDCAANGVPYLRFYYDHDGWWNTRAYLRARVSAALNR